MKIKSGLLVLAALLSLANMPMNVSAMSTYHQHRYALKKPNLRKFHVVHNANHTSRGYHYRYVKAYLKNPFEKKPNYIRGKRHAHKLVFKTAFFLPGTKKRGLRQFKDPQGVAVTPDGHYAFVSYNVNPNSQIGWVTRYDLKQLRRLGINTHQMDLIRRVLPFHHHHHHSMTPLERKVRRAIVVGPKFRMGHGQSLSYNPKTKKLWVLGIGPGAQKYANAQRISTHTLRPLHKIKFTFSKLSLLIDDILTFDKHGNAYDCVCTHGGPSNGMVRIYKGHISDHKVRFKLFSQGIRHSPGDIIQSLDYNPKNNRLYLVSDGSIMSFPVNHLGHLKASQIKWTGFRTRREFEGLSFDRTGRSYLLVNRGVELLTTNQRW